MIYKYKEAKHILKDLFTISYKSKYLRTNKEQPWFIMVFNSFEKNGKEHIK
ncbi:hypothetical protein SAMN04487911_10890 [Arenibacter nanhaiticus]|uniref:Uncharacterized protein n=1 Tax=Arenibacter nanhaiticus TaxID=558155 RepID=A0A1M6FDI1_9FLAO|nr:hypothetical protein SAMN04487911_10890 [Arenibacter nanhaiticus]